MYMTMLAGLVALLHRYTGEDDIAIAAPFANRRGRESESLIGMILNNVMIRTTLDGDPTVSELIHNVRNVVLEADENQDVPFDRVVNAVQPVRDMSYNPLFQLMFGFHDEPMPERACSRIGRQGYACFEQRFLEVRPRGHRDTAFLTDLRAQAGLEGRRTDADLRAQHRSLRDCHDRSHAGALQIVAPRDDRANQSRRVSDLELLTEAERQRLLVEWNATASESPPEHCIHSLFEGSGRANPRRHGPGLATTNSSVIVSLTNAPIDSPTIFAPWGLGQGTLVALVRRAFAEDGCCRARHPQSRWCLCAPRPWLSLPIASASC